MLHFQPFEIEPLHSKFDHFSWQTSQFVAVGLPVAMIERDVIHKTAAANIWRWETVQMDLYFFFEDVAKNGVQHERTRSPECPKRKGRNDCIRFSTLSIQFSHSNWIIYLFAKFGSASVKRISCNVHDSCNGECMSHGVWLSTSATTVFWQWISVKSENIIGSVRLNDAIAFANAGGIILRCAQLNGVDIPLFMCIVASFGRPKYLISIFSSRPTCPNCRFCSKLKASLLYWILSFTAAAAENGSESKDEHSKWLPNITFNVNVHSLTCRLLC